ncbi:MAG: HemK2/MTQ2 family protein methyltransferase [Candidatus Micrarchaeota archaeon]
MAKQSSKRRSRQTTRQSKRRQVAKQARRASFNNLTLLLSPSVYEPADDSEMLAKYASKCRGKLLDMGTGSGVVALSARNCDALGVDISEEAVENARANAKANNSKACFMKSNLFSKVHGKFDVITFNPPYLPTAREERVRGALDLAFNGGKDGRKVIDKFLREFSKFLKNKGKLLMLHSSLADTEKTIKKLKALNFSVRVLEERKFFFEKLSVLEAKRKTR